MKIVLDIPEPMLDALNTVVSRCTTEASTHGQLTLEAMFQMLAEDTAMTETRPGSWEAGNMARVFQSHGYEI